MKRKKDQEEEENWIIFVAKCLEVETTTTTTTTEKKWQDFLRNCSLRIIIDNDGYSIEMFYYYFCRF